MLQLDKKLISACKEANFITAIETNGTIKIDFDIDWICVSPKAGSELLVNKGNELKVVYPQDEFDLKSFETLSFDHFFLQPMDSKDKIHNTENAIKFCLKNPKWKLSIQQHKILGID